jgi:hypothetical protein
MRNREIFGYTHWDDWPQFIDERKDNDMKRAKQSGMFRQGDVMVVAVERKPDLQPVEREGGRIVLAHGEVTGHAHAIADADAILLMDAKTLDRYLDVKAPVTLDHEEHSRIELPSGFYRVTIQREYRPEGIRKVLD